MKNRTERNRERVPNQTTLDRAVASYDAQGSYRDYLFPRPTGRVMGLKDLKKIWFWNTGTGIRFSLKTKMSQIIEQHPSIFAFKDKEKYKCRRSNTDERSFNVYTHIYKIKFPHSPWNHSVEAPIGFEPGHSRIVRTRSTTLTPVSSSFPKRKKSRIRIF